MNLHLNVNMNYTLNLGWGVSLLNEEEVLIRGDLEYTMLEVSRQNPGSGNTEGMKNYSADYKLL